MPSFAWATLRQLVSHFPHASQRLHSFLYDCYEQEHDQYNLMCEYVRQHCEGQRAWQKLETSEPAEWVCIVPERASWLRLTPLTWGEFHFYTHLAQDEVREQSETPISLSEMSGFMVNRLRGHMDSQFAASTDVVYAMEQGWVSPACGDVVMFGSLRWPESLRRL